VSEGGSTLEVILKEFQLQRKANMAKIKYMGRSDVRVIEKNEDFGGQLAEKTTKEIRWDWDNKHIIDTDEVGLSETAVTLLLLDPELKDVSDLDRIPTNEAQQIWRAMPKTEDAKTVLGGGEEGTPSPTPETLTVSDTATDTTPAARPSRAARAT
jgi:hypothetical protein